MLIGIAGLGLIGGSFAKSIKARTSHRVFAADIDAGTLSLAMASGIIDGELTPDSIPDCEIIIAALPPVQAVNWLKQNALNFSHDTLVTDSCGVKLHVCREIFPAAREHGFTFIGGHPMAGRELGGFTNSTAGLFDGASMILTPDSDNQPDSKIMDEAANFFRTLGFGSVVVTTSDEHDQIIAYTSHLPHIISSAYVNFPDASGHANFTAGSFRDISRVSVMDENLWAELFTLNRDFLSIHLKRVIANMKEYLDALEGNNSEKLRELIRAGHDMKLHAGRPSL